MADVVVFDENATPQRVTQILLSVHTPDFSARTDVVISPDLSAVTGVPRRYWKHDGGAIVEYTQAEKDAQDAAEVAANDLDVRTRAKARLVGFGSEELELRALISIIMDEFNILRNLHGLAPRTMGQLKTALNNRIDSGSVDS